MSPGREAWRRFKRHRLAVVCAFILGFIILAVLLGPWIWRVPINEIDFTARMQGPSWAHPLGTDDLGQDLLARMLYGGRISLAVGLAAMVIAITVGVVVGAVAGMSKGPVDVFLMWLTDLFLSLPQLPLLLLIFYLFNDTLKKWVGAEMGVFILVVAVIGGLRWMPVARLVRAQFLSLREKEFVEAARALGASPWRQVTVHILPNAMGPVIVAATIDVAAASREGVLVTRASPGFGPAVAEWVMGVMIDLARHITDASAAYRQGQVVQPRMGRELRGACVGIIGYGEIGRRVARLALAFDMRVCVHDPHVQPQDPLLQAVTLPELLAQADHVVCLAPALPETDKLIHAQALACMKPTAYFINASRGQVVDEAALLQALDQGTIAGAALDVGMAADQMPSPALASHPRVIATPHVGGLTPEAIAHQALETVAQASDILQGRMPPGAVNAGQASRLVKRFAP